MPNHSNALEMCTKSIDESLQREAEVPEELNICRAMFYEEISVVPEFRLRSTPFASEALAIRRTTHFWLVEEEEFVPLQHRRYTAEELYMEEPSERMVSKSLSISVRP